MDSGGALRPAVAGRPSGASLWVAIGGAVVMGLLVLVFLVSRRGHEPPVGQVSAALPPAIAAPPPPADLALAEAAGRAPAFAVVGPQAPMPVPPPPIPQPVIAAPASGGGAAAALDVAQRRRAPSLIVDLDAGPAPSTAAGSGRPGAEGGPGSKVGPILSGEEQFSERIGAAEPDHARATILSHPRSVVPQGTMIPAVLETAMNSDLPGYVRAVVSRDVRGFDGASVLIPRGSRLVGQYRSGLSQGASRIFVIWTRVLRPDGVSVQIASPGGDPLGRAGQEGKVHSHFLRQFTSAILLSVINAGVSQLSAQPNTQIVIGGTVGGLASSVAPSAVAQATGGGVGGGAIPPTITVLQGAPISIFVARDLDFTAVQGSER